MSPSIGEIIDHGDIVARATVLWGAAVVAKLKETTDPAEFHGRLRQNIAEYEAKRLELKRQTTRPTWNDTVNAPSGRAPHKRPKTGPVDPPLEGKYLPGDFFKMPNLLVDDLLNAMPGPVMKGYMVCHRLANPYGVFWCSGETMATKIGSHDPRLGRRVIARLRQAGMLLLNARGSKATRFANTYQLVPLAMLDMDRVKDVVQRPLQERG